ncbi:Protein YIF1B [Papilio machaon]|uniref:Protein YIF1 n=1 Tax=Papilio machaon TaxID=76193 RepID=A0A194RHL2_PAPMA|nr:protein YIF1B [Papilio machaon]KPJ17057.1 Protein YIF1B [Papilio machaon]
MNFNASRNVSLSGGPRKAKRVSDVSAMGAPSPVPQYSPNPMYNPGYPPAGPPPPYQEGIELDHGQDFAATEPSGNLSYASGYGHAPMASPAQIGSFLQQPAVQDMALQYGNQLAAQGREVVQREIGRYVPVSRLRYYFAVDTRYVIKKLLLIMFPYTHKDWMVKYDQDTPVQPRYDINAPDLYIPSMGYVTYVLLAGFMLGLQHRFSPEQIGIQASSALAYIIFEMILYLVTLYITNTTTNLKTLDLLAYSGYKYIIMIGSLLAGLILGKTGYYCCLVYSSFALSYFLVKTLRLQLLSGAPGPEQPSYGYPDAYSSPNPYADNWSKPTAGGTKRRVYFLLFVAITQPLLSWWLTYHLVPSQVVILPSPAL